MLTRRTLLLTGTAFAAGAVLLGGCAQEEAAAPRPTPAFVKREGTAFSLDGKPYRYVGTNMWYAAYLGAEGPAGDRARLQRELDMLASIGIDNIRILGSSEASPLKGSITPSFRTADSTYNEDLLKGLDFALAEMGKRNMRAVIYLTNFWEWSGGMMTYLHWVNGGKYINMNDPAHPWPAFADFTADFYTSKAVEMYHDYVRTLVTRTNSITGIRYIDDPAIMSWQLANEPRPGGSEAVVEKQFPAYLAWVKSTAQLIKSLDPNHLVSTGSEGLQGKVSREDLVIETHAPDEIDYLTAHIWPQNWSWVDPKNLEGTFENGATKAREYIARHIAIAEKLGKPLVVEEYGFPRDEGRFDPQTATSFRDRFYGVIFEAVEKSVREGGPLVASNFWAWGGEGQAAHPDFVFRQGDTRYLGDPPHEPQGWYSVLATDESTKTLIRTHAAALAATQG